MVNQILFGDDALSTAEVRDDAVAVPLRTPAQLPADLYSFGGLLAPEVLAGLKMNLNRPFGDGRDNNGNGVVDEPQEAGEPYLYVLNNQAQVQVAEPAWIKTTMDSTTRTAMATASSTSTPTATASPIRSTWWGARRMSVTLPTVDGVPGVFEPTVDHVWIDSRRRRRARPA